MGCVRESFFLTKGFCLRNHGSWDLILLKLCEKLMIDFVFISRVGCSEDSIGFGLYRALRGLCALHRSRRGSV